MIEILTCGIVVHVVEKGGDYLVHVDGLPDVVAEDIIPICLAHYSLQAAQTRSSNEDLVLCRAVVAHRGKLRDEKVVSAVVLRRFLADVGILLEL